MVLRNSSYPDRPMAISFRKPSQLSAQVFMDVLGMILQSNREFLQTDIMTVHVDIIRPQVGCGRTYLHNKPLTEKCLRKYSIVVTPDFNDNKCLAYALVIGRAHKTGDPNFAKLVKGGDLLKQQGQ